MAAAGAKCRREFKFSVLDSALNYFPEGKGEEVLLQGVIDAWFEGADGSITVVFFYLSIKIMSSPNRLTAPQGMTLSSSRPSRPKKRRRPGTTSART